MSNGDSFRGIFTIPSTPFQEDGQIDIPGFRRVVDFCVDCGAHGLVFPVNASEWIHLTDDERQKLTEVLVEQNAGRIPVVVSVTSNAKEGAAYFAEHAKSVGVDAVIALPPVLRMRSHSEDIIFDYYKEISDKSGLPVFIQNWTGPIGTPMSSNFLLRMCREIEHVSYIKEETYPSTIRLTEVVEGNDGSVKGFFGGSGGRYLIEEYRRKTDGNMPGCHVTDVVVAFWNALESGDEERAEVIYKEMAPLFFFESQLSGCYKEVLKRRGVIDSAKKRNGDMVLDEISSAYLDEILEKLEPLMAWKNDTS
ncbi:MAG: dihydrodipicolinate synthase family protein [Opitutaceae bacterium]|nr:dihydrodipicolinate synthase family protein [Opitutaceae bacterium]